MGIRNLSRAALAAAGIGITVGIGTLVGVVIAVGRYRRGLEAVEAFRAASTTESLAEYAVEGLEALLTVMYVVEATVVGAVVSLCVIAGLCAPFLFLWARACKARADRQRRDQLTRLVADVCRWSQLAARPPGGRSRFEPGERARGRMAHEQHRQVRHEPGLTSQWRSPGRYPVRGERGATMAHSDIPRPWEGPGGDPPIVRGIRNAVNAEDVEAAAKRFATGVVATHVTGDQHVGGEALSYHAVIQPHRSESAYWRDCTDVRLAVAWKPYADGCRIPIPRAVLAGAATLMFHVGGDDHRLGWFPLTPETGCRLAWALERPAHRHDPAPVRRASGLRWDTPLHEILEARDAIQQAIATEEASRNLAALRTAARWTLVALEHRMLGGEL